MDLGGKVFQSLAELKPRLAAPEDTTPEPTTPHGMRTIPAPPEPYIAYPYTMSKEDFFGRTAELGKLDAWATSGDTALVVEAIGGVGKSALTWQWFQTGRAAAAIPGLAGAVWFSFYESDATVGRFALETLAYVTGQSLYDLKGLSRDEVEAQLFAALRAKPYFLVLDGIERILVAYHRMDAPQVTDEEIEEADKKQAEDVRRCTDPRHAEFLQKLIACAPSKLLISTRLFPRDLADHHDAHRPLPGVARLPLNGLDPDDAMALIRYRGVYGKTADLKRFMSQFGYHSLLIGAVAGRIANYFPAPGNFAAWYSDEGKGLRLDDLDLAQKRTHVLAYALNDLPREQARLLSLIAAFRYPVTYDALSTLNPYVPPKPESVDKPNESLLEHAQEYLKLETLKLQAAQTDEEKEYWQQAIEADRRVIDEEIAKQAAYTAYRKALRAYEDSSEMREARSRFHANLSALEARGLLQWNRAINRYYLHPVVRSYALEWLESADRAAIFDRIQEYFNHLPLRNLDDAQEVENARHALESFHISADGTISESAVFHQSAGGAKPPIKGPESDSRGGKRVKIFLSYAREDEEQVREIYHRLKQIGHEPWLDKENLHIGQIWQQEIRKAIRNTDLFIACLSQTSVRKRGYLQVEFRLALETWETRLESDIYILPLRLDDCMVPEQFAQYQWGDYFAPDGWERLVRAIDLFEP